MTNLQALQTVLAHEQVLLANATTPAERELHRLRIVHIARKMMHEILVNGENGELIAAATYGERPVRVGSKKYGR
jgi:hypothetical protein